MTQSPTPNQANIPGTLPGNTKLVVIALVLAVVAVILVNIYITVDRQRARVDEITVYRLRVPVRPGEQMTEQLLQEVRFPITLADAFAGEVLDRRGKDNRLGQPFVHPAREGQILTADLFQSRDTRRLDLEISRDRRQIALPVNSRAVPGALREGAFVDVEAPFIQPDGSVKVLPVMEYIEVMAVGDRSVLDDQIDASGRVIPRGSFQRIDIQVTPDQATLLAQIKRITAGDFEIHVRNPSDSDLVKIEDGGINPEVISLIGRVPAFNPRQDFPMEGFDEYVD